jgi:Fe-S cluster assembly protein SufD
MTNLSKNKTKKDTSSSQRGLKPFNFTYDLIPSVSDTNLHDYRETAWRAYESLPFPSRKEEAWGRTDIRGLQTTEFVLHRNGKHPDVQAPPSKCLEPIHEGEQYAGQILSGTVGLSRYLEEGLEEKGVVFTDYLTAEKDHPDLLKKLLRQIINPHEDKFTALASALSQDGVVLYVPKDVVIENPLHSLYCGSVQHHAYINHLIIWLEEGAQVTFVHESASPPKQKDGQILHTGIVEIYVGKAARLNFVELQSWSKNVWSFTRERANVMGDGSLEWIFGAMGTHLTKNFSDINLVEPGASARMSGFYFADGHQHLDHDTQQNHLAKYTTSDLLFKGALLDESHSVWQGMIYVAPGAIGTDGYQGNRNLILSKGARADSIPGLEILADDVRCTHGATVGRIDENELFYLTSRGIPRGEAEQLIVLGFFDRILQRIPFDGVKNRFVETIREKMMGR